MYRVTKKEAKQLKKMAQELPTTYYEAKRDRIVDGAEALKNKKIDKGGFAVAPNSMYIVSKNDLFPVNHEKRIVKAYEHKGMEGVQEYCTKVLDLVQSSAQPIQGFNV
jgi:hypothetical protein